MTKVKHENRNKTEDKHIGKSGLSKYKVRKEGVKSGKQQAEIKEMLQNEVKDK